MSGPTEPIAEPIAEPAAARRPGGGLVSGVAGVLVCVLLIMAVGMIVAQVLSGHDHQPGPGTLTIVWHVLAAAGGVVCYRLTRRAGAVRLVALGAIVAITVLLLWFFWWSPG